MAFGCFGDENGVETLWKGNGMLGTHLAALQGNEPQSKEKMNETHFQEKKWATAKQCVCRV